MAWTSVNSTVVFYICVCVRVCVCVCIAGHFVFACDILVSLVLYFHVFLNKYIVILSNWSSQVMEETILLKL